jgi:hypothetical protein
MKVYFDTQNDYYIPQYWPVCEKLLARGHECTFVVYGDQDSGSAVGDFLADRPVEVLWVSEAAEAHGVYTSKRPEWILFGNGFLDLDAIHEHSQTAQLGHGIGPKPSYYHKSYTPMSVRFMEGALRLETIRKLYPEGHFVQVGFAKLDPLFSGTEAGIDIAAVGLDPSKPTILYAPTFKPSSLERFPNNWPKDFADYNILVKPHAFTLTKSRYKNQQRKLARWAKFDNVHVSSIKDLSLLPFMKVADLLMSEASSTLFEFAALDRPVIVCDFFKLNWTYMGPFRYRFNRRFNNDSTVQYTDIGQHASSYKDVLAAVRQQLAGPDEYGERRQQYTLDHVGPTDGQASARIADYLELQVKS